MPLTFALQALLVRHEAYVADSERERRQMAATIEALEKEKLELEERNAETIKANRGLLDQLEQLNAAVTASDAHVQALTNTLHSAEEEIQRLSSLAARTQDLERQLIDLEREQASLQGALETKIGDERTAVQRWRRAEKMIGDLQDQIDRIEAEAREERERHVEIVARMERQMAVGGELAATGGRLKAKASREAGETSVVSHFVKDILLDNANLQHGILELREMLQNSNEEVERLREQLQVHQPISPTKEDAPTSTALDKELGTEPVFNQALHIHHHYHGAVPKKEAAKIPVQRRTRKKRLNLPPGKGLPPRRSDVSSTATILSQTAVTVPPNIHRWSNATTLAASSAPGSPLSASHRGSIYERVFSDVAYDSSRPTSPSDSLNLTSPIFENNRCDDDPVDSRELLPSKRMSQRLKPPSLATIRSASSPISLTTKSSPASAIISAASPPDSLSNDVFVLSPSLHATIPEENEDGSTNDINSFSEHPPDSGPPPDNTISPISPAFPPLRRPASHESLISISGMDIHTLQSRPSQLLFSTSPRLASPLSSTSPQPVLTPWTATATPSRLSRRYDIDSSTLYGSLIDQHRGAGRTLHKTASTSKLGKKVGGWVFGKWGAAPAPATAASSSSTNPSMSVAAANAKRTAPPPAKSTPAPPLKIAPAPAPPAPIRFRPPGINQTGPLLGFFDAIPPTPVKVVVTDLDTEALGEALREDGVR
ncbi:uncharacterized protein EI97DRAFT_383615 [Westerdykella ornata]|uniref:Uncharacterized protein n=1 Tax=Westerdykella ornata TaxID=318751 RepID=A0A6A6JBK9_WESOR|nr:uncharacterized protein EI97DRAFT_383615 [Westerdykella ornata]KAF2273378.1 hypothetical protein EI97DRAFT_383615 [Westerdykella ornata]